MLKRSLFADKTGLIQATLVRIPDATERKVLVLCFGVSGFLCAAPGDIVSAGVLWTLSLIAFGIHLRLLRKEEATAPPAAPPPAATLNETNTESDKTETESAPEEGSEIATPPDPAEDNAS